MRFLRCWIPYKEILCSPSFFYIGIPGELSAHEARENYKLAERLAFSLWCSVPDDRLLQGCIGGRIDKTVRARVTCRVDVEGREVEADGLSRFADQWLQTSKLFNVAVDRNYYPAFQRLL